MARRRSSSSPTGFALRRGKAGGLTLSQYRTLVRKQAKAKANPTKAQRKARAKKLSAKRRVANALKAYLQKANPGRKLAGANVQKNKGSITIVPVFLKKRK